MTQPVSTPLQDSAIMVVDDSATNCAVIGALLRRAGFRNITILEDGQSALAEIEKQTPDLLLLDILMPVMDGYETCRHLRADARWAGLPVLAMTGLEQADERTRVFDAGATDLILKPIHPPELIARATIHLENARLIRGMREHIERSSAELAAARQMQEALLPDAAAIAEMARRYGVSLAAHFAPSEEVGGDLWGAWPVDEHRFAVFAFDVVGHGTIAAINGFRIHTLLSQDKANRGDPVRMLEELNQRLHGLLRIGQFATMVYAVFDVRLNQMRYAGAGYTNPVMLHRGAIQALDGSGLPIGITATARYEVREAAWAPGDGIVLYSDALSEARDGSGGLLGEDTTQALCRDALALGDAARALDHLRQQAERSSINDDLTLLCLTR